jgi:hypothetical protein
VISARKVFANRANARASTGPRTTSGKVKVAHNARRHGLTLSVLLDPAHEAELEAMARDIAGQDASPELRALASRIAAAQIDLVRVRRARHDLLSRRLRDPEYRYIPLAAARKEVKFLARLLRTVGPDAPVPDGFESVLDKPVGPGKFATILFDVSADLAIMDRYERRALSRRKFAIREFDGARRR